MEFRHYVQLLRKQWPLVLLSVTVAAAVAGVLTLRATPRYVSETTLFVSLADRGLDASSAYSGGLFSQQRVKSYADIVEGRQVAQLVVDDLRLKLSADEVAGEISAVAIPDTVLLKVTVTDSVPRRAQAIAASVGRVFAKLATDLETPPGGTTAPVKVSVVQQPKLATSPVSPRPLRTMSLGVILGLLAGVGLAVLRDSLDNRVRSADDLREATGGVPILGLIGHDADAKRHPLTVHVSPRSRRAEAFRQLRTNLQFVDVDHQPRSITVTSSVPEEGKTTSGCNLAIALASAGTRVALLEGDLRRPKMANYLGIEGAAGLTSVLIGRADLDAVLQPWGGDLGLTVLPSGPIPPNPAELLASKALGVLLKELKSRFDLVLVDAPPLLPVTDGAILAAATDGALLVVRSHWARREQVRQAVESLTAVDARLLGVVMNMIPTRGPDAHVYTYGYGEGYESRRPTVPPSRPSGDAAPRPVTQVP